MKSKVLQRFVLCITASLLFWNLNIATHASTLTPCENSAQFQARLNNNIKKLENKLTYYKQNSQEYTSIKQQIEKTKIRFDKYAKSSLLCGEDGLPHLITDGDWQHSGEFFIPSVLFIYIAGWIGWAGKGYLQYSKTLTKPNENEIIIDLPRALKYMFSGFAWPILALKEFKNGSLLASNDEITTSPR
uniref:Photosystem I reaction center subunit III n=1 Tax=Cyanidium caldarium TaxID=2771 RepID=PSAF_CYACA|nr:photosystem I subunit III [Cyanidium caldarium]Q9TLW6.1 RecName: Full=Photosystem I reaction center subunit III; AltName: Full=PSI-F; Flags: Precursor [Cyanidium caldarium]AAF12941.1 unknown [Cyanidium caldarium]WDB00276.1 photosystem I subunit III [Cyanidium caldarium]